MARQDLPVVPAWWPAVAVQVYLARSIGVRKPRLTCTYALRRIHSDPSRSRWQCGGQGFESPQLHPDDLGVLLSRGTPVVVFGAPVDA